MPDSSGATVLDDLPEESIVIQEILVRLPPKDVLRCRAVRKSWRSGTSTHQFQLDHHRRQPPRPLIHLLNHDDYRLVVLHDDAAGAVNRKLCRPVLRHPTPRRSQGRLWAVCDGLLLVSSSDGTEDEHNIIHVCNPATRRSAPLSQLQAPPDSTVRVFGFYRHQPTGEYRVLWDTRPRTGDTTNSIPDLYVLAAGSGGGQPRCIGRPSVAPPSAGQPEFKWMPLFPPVSHRGDLHWELGRPYHQLGGSDIVVFHTAAETFRRMRGPVWTGRRTKAFLEMDGTLALCSITDHFTLDISVLQDYDAETWAFKYKINVAAMEASPPLDFWVMSFFRMAVFNHRELLIQIPHGMFRCDMDGKFLGYVQIEQEYVEANMFLTFHRLQESIVSVPSSEAQHEDLEPAFILGM